MSLLLLLVRVQFIDLKISGVRGKRESGQGWTGPVGPQREWALSQVQEDPRQNIAHRQDEPSIFTVH